MGLRSPAALRLHYEVEVGLAERLRAAPREARPRLYTEVYDELFRRLPDHPALVAARDPGAAAKRARSVAQQMRFLARFLRKGMTFMEVGAGDCALAVQAAKVAAQAYALDVSAEPSRATRKPANLKLLITGGAFPLPDGAVALTFSNQLMEHLHPDDALEQLREIHRTLAPGGLYVCITPNRLYGPKDISGYFDDEPRGLHLREYSAGELRQLLLECGFASVQFYAGGGGRFVPVPYALVRAAEALLRRLPVRLRRRLADTAPLRALLGVRAAAMKPPLDPAGRA